MKFQDTKFAKRGFKKSTQHLISREYRHLEQAVREKQRERKFVRIARIKILAWLYFYNIKFTDKIAPCSKEFKRERSEYEMRAEPYKQDA